MNSISGVHARVSCRSLWQVVSLVPLFGVFCNDKFGGQATHQGFSPKLSHVQFYPRDICSVSFQRSIVKILMPGPGGSAAFREHGAAICRFVKQNCCGLRMKNELRRHDSQPQEDVFSLNGRSANEICSQLSCPRFLDMQKMGTFSMGAIGTNLCPYYAKKAPSRQPF